jgi:hypothetical protein
MKGNFLLGLNFLVIKLYPMRPGGADGQGQGGTRMGAKKKG